MARLIMKKFKGNNSELTTSFKYLNQSFIMPDDRGKNIFLYLGTEKLNHHQILSTIIIQLIIGPTHYNSQNKRLISKNNHHPFLNTNQLLKDNATLAYFDSSGNVLTDIANALTYETKSQKIYENLINLSKDNKVSEPLIWFRQRTIVHHKILKDLYNYYNHI